MKSVLVAYHCCNTLPQISSLKTPQIYYHMVLEVTSSK